MDDEQWEEIWEHTLDPLERHRIVRTTWRREFPLDPLEKRLVPELARRWRRKARNHALGHLLLIAFWSAVVVGADPSQGNTEQFGAAMAFVSVAAVAMTLVIRHHLEPVTRYG